jgi:hypothetical protein
MESTAELAGFFAAHAVWSVSDGSTLVPILAFEKPDGSRMMHRLVSDELQESVARGREWLEKNPEASSRAVLIYDGFVTLETGKTDALLVEAHLFGPEEQSFVMAIPYRHAESPAGFAVHRPKFLSFEGVEPDPAALGTAFFRGVGQHVKASKVWSEHLDESL